MSMEKWQACPLCVKNTSFVSLCQACCNERIIHLETGFPPTRHRALVFGSGVDFTEEGPKIFTGTGIGICGKSHEGGITGSIVNPRNNTTITK